MIALPSRITTADMTPIQFTVIVLSLVLVRALVGWAWLWHEYQALLEALHDTTRDAQRLALALEAVRQPGQGFSSRTEEAQETYAGMAHAGLPRPDASPYMSVWRTLRAFWRLPMPGGNGVLRMGLPRLGVLRLLPWASIAIEAGGLAVAVVGYVLGLWLGGM